MSIGQVTYASGEFINGTNFISGPVTVCVNGITYTLCNKGLNDTVASLLCRDQGYYGPAYATPLFGSESADFGPSTSSYAIYNISCPYDYFSTYDCSYAIDESGSGCEYYYGRAIITCLSEGIYA